MRVHECESTQTSECKGAMMQGHNSTWMYKIMRMQFKSETVAKQECYLEHDSAKAQRYKGIENKRTQE